MTHLLLQLLHLLAQGVQLCVASSSSSSPCSSPCTTCLLLPLPPTTIRTLRAGPTLALLPRGRAQLLFQRLLRLLLLRLRLLLGLCSLQKHATDER